MGKRSEAKPMGKRGGTPPGLLNIIQRKTVQLSCIICRAEKGMFYTAPLSDIASVRSCDRQEEACPTPCSVDSPDTDTVDKIITIYHRSDQCFQSWLVKRLVAWLVLVGQAIRGYRYCSGPLVPHYDICVRKSLDRLSGLFLSLQPIRPDRAK